MRVNISADERWPTMVYDGPRPESYGDYVNVPPRLLSALETAKQALDKAERAIVKHLLDTDQAYTLSASWDEVVKEVRNGKAAKAR